VHKVQPTVLPAAADSILECGGELNADNTVPAAGPGAQRGPGTALIGDYINRRT
jgi:hypothetical protein